MHIYAVGRKDIGEEVTRKVECFHSFYDEWVYVADSKPPPVRHLQLFSMKDKLLVYGGYEFNSKNHKTFFEIENGIWKSKFVLKRSESFEKALMVNSGRI